jgi:hypothetical protein
MPSKQIIAVLSAFIITTAIHSQAGKTTSPAPAAADNADAPVSGRTIRMLNDPVRYLDFFMKRSRENIGRLKILVETYESDVPGSKKDFTDIQADYRQGLHSYYLGERHNSLIKMEKTYTSSNELLRKYSDFFKKGSGDIIKASSEALTDRDLAAVYDPSTVRPGSSETISKGQFRIRMAFQQMVLAEEARNKGMYDQSIEHYIMARLYGVTTMLELETDETKKKAIAEKYKKEIADAKTKPDQSASALIAPEMK